MGAGFGDFPRLIVAPTDIPDCFKTVPELLNLVDSFQCPGIVPSDLLLSGGRSSPVDPTQFDFYVPIDRGEVVGLGASPPLNGRYNRYQLTETVSRRALYRGAGL